MITLGMVLLASLFLACSDDDNGGTDTGSSSSQSISSSSQSSTSSSSSAGDTVDPVLSLLHPSTNIAILSNQYLFSGTAGDETQLDEVRYSLDNGAHWSAISSSSNWSATLTLTGWSNYLSFAAFDGAGNQSAVTSITALAMPKLYAGDPEGMAYLGMDTTMSADGSTLVATAQMDDSGEGSAYIFTNDNGVWQFATKLKASDAASPDEFGCNAAVSSDGGVVVVGAYRKNTYDGCAYVYVRSGTSWTGTTTENAQLSNGNTHVNDNFGQTVAISGDGNTIACAAPHYNGFRGHVYVFKKPGGGWSGTLGEDAILTNSNNADEHYLGVSLVMNNDGSLIVVGAYGQDSYRGRAYVFHADGAAWSGTHTEDAVLQMTTRSANDYFGINCAISGDGSIIACGAMLNSSDNSKGAAYVFTKPGSAWTGTLTPDAVCTASDRANNDKLASGQGRGLALNGDGSVLFAGSENHSSSRGKVYVFAPTTWSGNLNEDCMITALDGEDYDYFGNALSCSSDGGILAVGANQVTKSLSDQGAVYILGRPANGW